MKDLRVPVLCVLLSAACFTLSSQFGGAWWLGWIAPVPVLWFAFGETNPVAALGVALGAGGLAGLGQILPWLGIVPQPTVAAAVALSAIGFGVCVTLARYAGRTLMPAAAPLAFAALWTVWDFIAASGPDGALASPAFSQAAVPILIQSAALFGGWIVTFLLGAVAGYAALAFAERNSIYLLPAAALFMCNLAFGALHMQQDEGPERHVVMIDSDALAEASAVDQRDIALGAVLSYAAKIRLTAMNADLVVLPERIAILRPAWRGEAVNYLRAVSTATGATIVAGFEDRGNGPPRNIALSISPDGTVSNYVQGGESASASTAVAISHDLNFFAHFRTRMARERAGLLAIPAWDFGTDSTAQSHKAILRGVENGVAIARNARDGKLVLADALGRVIAQKRAGIDGFTVLAGDLPTGSDPGDTVYDNHGDLFVWFSAFLSALLVFGGFMRVLAAAAPARDIRTRPLVHVPVLSWSRYTPAARHAATPSRR